MKLLDSRFSEESSVKIAIVNDEARKINLKGQIVDILKVGQTELGRRALYL